MDDESKCQLELADKVFQNFEILDSTCEEIFLFFNKNVSNIKDSAFYIELMRKTTESALKRYEDDMRVKDIKLGFVRLLSYSEMYNSTESSLKALCADSTQQDILISRFRACRKFVQRQQRTRAEALDQCLVRRSTQ